MKKILFSLCLAFSLFATTAMASETEVTKAALHSFTSSFNKAINVSWSQVDGFQVAKFTLNNKVQYAYYTAGGELKVLAQPIAFNDLTERQKINLHKDFADYTIADLYKIEDEDGVKTFAVLETASRKVILSTTTNQWTVVRSRAK